MKRVMIAVLLGILGVSALAAESLTVVRGIGNWKPYEWEENGEYAGFHMELVRKAAESAGLEITIKALPWSRALNEVKTGSAAAITFAAKSPERETYAYFDDRNTISMTNYSIAVLKGKSIPYDGKLSDLKGLTVGVIQDFYYGSTFDEEKKNLKIDKSPSIDVGVKKLITGRIDALIVNVSEFTASMRGTPSFEKLTVMKPNFDGQPNYIAFSRKGVTKAQVDRFAEAMERIKAGSFYAQLRKKYGME